MRCRECTIKSFRETGAGPRGDRSRFIETDSGVVQSKYRYMGFGLWENLDPTAPKKLRKPKPPPPPPKAEPIWYNCTVSVSNTVNSKELDDLVTINIFTSMESRQVWCRLAMVLTLLPERSGPLVAGETSCLTVLSPTLLWTRRTSRTCSAERPGRRCSQPVRRRCLC